MLLLVSGCWAINSLNPTLILASPQMSQLAEIVDTGVENVLWVPRAALSSSCPQSGHTMSFGSTANVLAECKLEFHRISERGMPSARHADQLDELSMRGLP